MRYSDNNQQKLPTLRRSQTITTFGVGAIADLPEASVMICGIDKWDTRGGVRISDPRLERKLGVNYFLMPPSSDAPGDGITAVRFPRWMRCRKCKQLKSLESWREAATSTSRFRYFDEKPYCYLCSLTLIPSRFVVACHKGHIDDFPFVEWSHSGKEVCSKPELKYTERGNSAALSGIWISCTNCDSAKSMGGSFTKETMENIATCKGSMPWEMVWSDECGAKLTTLQRGGTNVHFPMLKSSILIPPHSTEGLKTKITNNILWAAYESQEDESLLDSLIGPIALQINEPVEKVREVIDDMLGNANDAGDDKSEEDYRYEEFRAFLGEYDQDSSDKHDFLVEKQDLDKYRIPIIKNLVLVKKLREIRVQTGFSRIKPPQAAEEDDQEDEEKIEIMPVTKNKRIKWLPGYEVRGEGLFIEFDSKALNNWSNSAPVKKHYKKLIERSSKNPDSFGVVEELTPEFLFLHTMSHALIRQLSFECGYSSSALRERLYCSSKKGMFGILIYTAEGDSDGTLGGLVRQGEADLFPETVYRAVGDARWCSSDPLCIESEGQGYQALNLAACHSCCMLPETSCESLNRYLDRASLIGSLSDPEIGLYSETINQLMVTLGE